MRHHLYNSNYQFVKEPEEFDRNAEREFLQFCLGATMYMPGTKNFTDAIIQKKYPGLTSIVMCFEDACREDEVPMAERNVIHMLDVLSDKLESKELTYKDIPIVIVRIRNIDEFHRFSEMLRPEHMKILAAFNFPKFNSVNGEKYFQHLEELNSRFGQIIYGMPIIEDRSVAYIESRKKELSKIKAILDNHRRLVLNIRVGCTDFSGIFGVRRDVDYTIYDIVTVRDILSDILNIFGRENEYVVSGPVWEYFKINRSLKFDKIPKIDLQQSLLRRTPLINNEVDGLMRELILDKANGFIGKTIIHPSHIKYVNGMLAVTLEEYEDAEQILKNTGGVKKSTGQNRMNEVEPHRLWAQRIIMRAKAYGVIKNEQSYIELFGQEN